MSKSERRHISFEEAVEEHDGSDMDTTAGAEIVVRFGLVKERRTYVQDFAVPQLPAATTLEFVPQQTTGNAEVAIARVPQDELAAKGAASAGKEWLRATLYAARAGPLDEAFESTSRLVVRVTGRVMGASAGTPSLRAGVHCVGVAPLTDSEVDSGPEFRAHPHAHARGGRSHATRHKDVAMKE